MFISCHAMFKDFGLDQKKSLLRPKSVILWQKWDILLLNTLSNSLKEEICINGLTAEGNA